MKMYSTGEIGAAIGVDRNTVLRWTMSGLIKKVTRTLGGHIRIHEDEFVKILKNAGWDDEKIREHIEATGKKDRESSDDTSPAVPRKKVQPKVRKVPKKTN